MPVTATSAALPVASLRRLTRRHRSLLTPRPKAPVSGDRHATTRVRTTEGRWSPACKNGTQIGVRKIDTAAANAVDVVFLGTSPRVNGIQSRTDWCSLPPQVTFDLGKCMTHCSEST